MRELVFSLFIVYYGAAIFYEVESCISGNWFAFDLKVILTMLVANSFVIIYLQLKRM
jgi:hypothetical protein